MSRAWKSFEKYFSPIIKWSFCNTTVCGIFRTYREHYYTFLNFACPALELKLPCNNNERYYLFCPRKVHIRTHAHNSFFFFLFFFFASPCTAFICLAATTGRLLSVRSDGGSVGGVGILLFVFSRLPSPYFTCLVSVFVHVGSDFVFIAYSQRRYVLCFTAPRLSLFRLLPSFLPSFHRAGSRLHHDGLITSPANVWITVGIYWFSPCI